MYKKVFIPILLIYVFVSLACVYVVLPEGLEEISNQGKEGNLGWTGIVTNVGESNDGDLRIDITIRNDTGDWSTMRAVDSKPAIMTTDDGNTIPCDTVIVSTGGHRLAPGFQMRGYISAGSGESEVQFLYVECKGVTSGSEMTIDYISFIGELDYYVEVEETNKVEGTLELNLNDVVTDLTYPIAVPVEGLIHDPEESILALSDNIISLKNVERSDTGFQFTWQNENPSNFPLKTHIGIPPVIGNDGVIYGPYVTIDMPEVPLTPAKSIAEWTTEVAVPQDIGELFILLSVESKKPRTYLNYAINLADY